MGSLLTAVSQLDHLFQAWRTVRPAVRHSSWPRLREDWAAMEAAPLRALSELQRQLRSGAYRFSAKRGYTKRKSGGSRRGITVHSLNDRLVQRAILDLFYSREPGVRSQFGAVVDVLECPTSFAGSPGRGVPEAVAQVGQAIRSGAAFFGLSDVKDFFPRIPRQTVVEFVRSQVNDDEFVALFDAALATQLDNPSDLAPWIDLFPIADMGVAQGSLLSVLVGNLALRQFDQQLNTGGVVTVRYLDDFCILGAERSDVADGFRRAQVELERLGMTCYAPGDGSQKAALGSVQRGFEFLGCRIHPSGVAPSRKARRQLRDAIDALIVDGKQQLAAFRDPATRRRAESAYIQTLAKIDRLVRGWGDAYRFVSNRVVFAQIDRVIDGQLSQFERWYRRQSADQSPAVRRRMRGVALLGDTPGPCA